MDVTYERLRAGRNPMDVVGGRLDLVSASQIKWGFQDSNQLRLFNPNTLKWEIVQATAEPTLANTALDHDKVSLKNIG